MSASELGAIVTRLENVTTRLENMADQKGSGGGGQEVLAPSVLAFDQILNGAFANFLNLSAKIGSDVKTHADMVKNAFDVQRQFLIIVSKSKEPAQNVLMDLLKPTSEQIQNIQNYREKNRTSNLFNHLSAISESIAALGWVAVSPTPVPYIKEMMDAGQFYTNRVLVDYKEKDKTHVDWVKAWLQTLSELQKYVKDQHITGLVWNSRGGDAAKTSPSGGAPPPPPPGPPPPPPSLMELNAMGDVMADDRAALFKQLNTGDDVTKGLRKVTADQQTHKNPALRTQGPAPYKPPATSPQPFKSQAPSSKPPKFELQGKKWIVEHQANNPNLLINNTEMNQTVYVYNCLQSTIQVKGKINSIILDACKKTSVVFDDIVASVEFINCQSVQAQSFGKVPTILIDKTDGVQIYLSPNSLDVEVVSSKSSEMNMLIPKGDGDYAEYPIPEQYKTKWTGKNLSTEVVEQKG